MLSAVLNQPVMLAAAPPPGAALDPAVPDAVLREGVAAEVPAEIMEIGGGGPPGTFVDFAPLHLLTSGTLDQIAALSKTALPRMSVPLASFAGISVMCAGKC